MQGLIFVTWEKYLSERFGSALLHKYRSAIGETAATAPLASQVYDDATLLAGVGAACQLTRLPADTLLWEYGRYFMLNGLTNHLCAYLLTQVQSGRDLLLAMRDAHAQMRRTPDAITPPLFAYEAFSSDPRALALIYESPRKLCSVLWGAIEGAAERYGEWVQIRETSCMKQGAAQCRFELRFSASGAWPLNHLETPQQISHRASQQQLDDLVLFVLPDKEGLTLAELQQRLHYWAVNPEQLRLSVLLKAVRHLRFAGLVATTANQPGEDLSTQRFWRAPTSDHEELGRGNVVDPRDRALHP